MQDPWGVVGDFNSITCVEEKLRGRRFNLNNNLDFISCIEDCGLQDAGFSGPTYTLCDQRDLPNIIRKCLERLLYNSQWFDNYEGTCATHLSKTCSDHAHLLIKLTNDQANKIKYFKFLNVWTSHQDFLQVVHASWEEEVTDNPLYVLQQKVKRTAKILSD